MTSQQFIDRYRHQFGGLVYDALIHRTGTDGANAAKRSFDRIETLLEEIYRLLHASAPEQNGKAVAPVQGVRR